MSKSPKALGLNFPPELLLHGRQRSCGLSNPSLAFVWSPDLKPTHTCRRHPHHCPNSGPSLSRHAQRTPTPTPLEDGNACPSCAKATLHRPTRHSNSRRLPAGCPTGKIRESASSCSCSPPTLILYPTSIPCSPIADDDHCRARIDGTDPVSPQSLQARTHPPEPCTVSHCLYGLPPRTDCPFGNSRPESGGVTYPCLVPSTLLRIPAFGAARLVPPDVCARLQLLPQSIQCPGQDEIRGSCSGQPGRRSSGTPHAPLLPASPSSAYTSFCRPIGSRRRRVPVAAKMALVIAGTIGEVPGSPVPVGAASLSTMLTLISGVSLMRAIR